MAPALMALRLGLPGCRVIRVVAPGPARSPARAPTPRAQRSGSVARWLTSAPVPTAATASTPGPYSYAYAPPSSLPGRTLAAELSKVSLLVPDTVALRDDSAAGFAAGGPAHGTAAAGSLHPDAAADLLKPTAASASYQLLSEIISSSRPSRFGEGLVESALTYGPCLEADGGENGRAACFRIKALANLAALYADLVPGRVAVEVDAHLAHDAHALVAAARTLAGLLRDMGVSKDRLLFRVPATSAGLAAVRALESEGLACLAGEVYCREQALAAIDAGASVVCLELGKLRAWYATHPNAIRDPAGPRQDAGALAGSAAADPALRLCEAAYSYAHRGGGPGPRARSRLLAAGVRSVDDALALAGLDILVLPPKVITELAALPSDAGYNNGIHGGAIDGRSGDSGAVGAGLAAAAAAAPLPAPVSAAALEAALSAPGPAADLMAEDLQARAQAVLRVEQTLAALWPPPNV